MIEFLLGLSVGLFMLIIYAVLVFGAKYDSEMENARLRRELKILKGGKDEKIKRA